MPELSKTGLSLVLQRFSQDRDRVLRQYLANGGFKDICAELALAVDTLERFKRLPDAPTRPEISEYTNLIEELWAEIRKSLSNRGE